MIGNNRMQLNEATMIQIVQKWLDEQMPTCTPKVQQVKSDAHSDYPFYVDLADKCQSDK